MSSTVIATKQINYQSAGKSCFDQAAVKRASAGPLTNAMWVILCGRKSTEFRRIIEALKIFMSESFGPDGNTAVY